MSDDEILNVLQKERIRKIYNLIKECLANAKDEKDCIDEENEMYADMSNLKESIDRYYDVEGF